MLEVIILNAQDAQKAAAADRFEVVSHMEHDGLSPSFETITAIRQVTDKPIMVIVRLRGGDFSYTKHEITAMQSYMDAAFEAGASGFVLGCLTSEHTIDTKALEALLNHARGLPVTLHRAFDAITNQFAALHILEQYPSITGVLTSGGFGQIVDHIEHLHALQRATRLRIVCGGGITIEYIPRFIKNNLLNIHLGSSIRIKSQFCHPIDPNRFQQARSLIPQESFQ